MDTEEWIDLMFYRPVGFVCALVARKFGIRPNAITIASIFLGLGAAIMIYYNDVWVNLGGMALLVMADVCDSADGQLARLTRQYSRLGRILDGLSGDIWFAAIYTAICLRENVTSQFFMAYPWLIWVMAVLTGICHATQASMADYYRQFHLLFVKGMSGTELEDSAAKLWKRYHDLSWRRDFRQKLVMMFYANYTAGQEKRTPRMQLLRAGLHARFGQELPMAFRKAFRAASKPLMKYTNFLSFNSRAIVLGIAVVVCRMPWLYFAFELTVLNVLLIYMMWRHERICKQFLTVLKENKYGTD